MTSKKSQQRLDEYLFKAKPLLKWAGGKSKLLNEIEEYLPSNFNKYIEPFVGGGALFFCLKPKRSLLADSNDRLIEFYKVVKGHPDRLIQALKSLQKMPDTKETYYEIRSKYSSIRSEIERAAAFLYLNKTAYNGLYRVNRRGQFNVPYSYAKLSLPDASTIYAASEALQYAELIPDDFERVLLTHCEKGDFAYLDPPYPPVGIYSDFTRYTKEFFDKQDHLRLLRAITEIDKRGCMFLLSNADLPFIREIYDTYRIVPVSAPRYINCRGDRRGNVPEVLVSNY